MKTKIYKDYQEFSNRDNKEDNGVSESFANDYTKYQEMNKSNKGCWIGIAAIAALAALAAIAAIAAIKRVI